MPKKKDPKVAIDVVLAELEKRLEFQDSEAFRDMIDKLKYIREEL